MRTAAVALLLAACSTPVRIGQPCERSSECTAPYVCAQGRCREECTEHRDCPLSARCLAGSDGVGVCTLEDDRCESAASCGEDLECRDGACFDACPLGTCPAGGVCAAGVCERPSAVDAGAPDADTEDAGPPELQRRACASSAECGAGAACTRVRGGAFTCRRLCSTLADCSPGDTAVVCATLDRIEGGVSDTCSLACDPFATSECAPGEACDLLELNGPVGTAVGFDCRPIDPSMRMQGEPCWITGGYDPTLCAAGFDCDGPSPEHECQELCSVGGSVGPECPSGTTCQSFGARYRGVAIGTCDPG